MTLPTRIEAIAITNHAPASGPAEERLILAFWADIDGAASALNMTVSTSFETACFRHATHRPCRKPMTTVTPDGQRSKRTPLGPVMRHLAGGSLSSLFGFGIRDSFASIFQPWIKRKKRGWKRVKW
jgi:hypothetical protein